MRVGGNSGQTLTFWTYFRVGCFLFDMLNTHIKLNMLWRLAIVTLFLTNTMNISIRDPISNTSFRYTTFHLWDLLDGQSSGLKLGAKQTPLRIYNLLISKLQMSRQCLIVIRKRTETLVKVLTLKRGGVQGTHKLHLLYTLPDLQKLFQLTCPNISTLQWRFGALTAP